MAGRLVHSVAGVALAATMVAVGGVPASAAADDPSSRQDESRLQLQTTGAVLDYGGQQYQFNGAGVTVLEEEQSSTPEIISVVPGQDDQEHDVERFNLGSQHPQLGQITIRLDDNRTDSSEYNDRALNQDQHTITTHLLVTMSPPARSAGPSGREPLVLSTKNPGKLIGQLDNFPPKGEIYQLENPISLVIPDNPGEIVATIDKFPVQVGGR